MEDHEAHSDTLQRPRLERPDGSMKGWHLQAVMGALVIAVLAMAMSASIVATAIPVLTSHFHSTGDIGWYGSAYLIANCALVPITGKIYTSYDLKLTFVAYMAIFTAGSAVSGAATSSNMLIAGRAIAGAGASGIITGSLAIINASVALDKRSLLVGIIQSLSGIGFVLGPIVGGALTDNASWRWCFFVGVPVCALAIVIIMLVPFPTRRIDGASLNAIQRAKGLDLIGAAIFAPSVVLLLVALEWGGDRYRWNDAHVIGLFCASGVIFILFLLWEAHVGDKAMVPLDVLRRQVMANGFATLGFQFGGLMLIVYYLPIWFQSVKEASPTMSGVMTLPQSVGQMIFSVVSGVLVSHTGYCTPWVIAGSACNALGCGLMLTFRPSTDTGKWIGYQFLLGVGRGLMIQNVFTAAQADLSREVEDIGSAILVFAMFLGGAIFIAIAQTIFYNSLPDELAKHAPSVTKLDIQQGLGAGTLKLLPQDLADGVQLAINNALINTFYLAMGGAAIGFVTSFGLKWFNINTKLAQRDPEIGLSEKHKRLSSRGSSHGSVQASD